jgi:hypothetical protein
MRRVVKSREPGEPVGDITTLDAWQLRANCIMIASQ